MKNTPLVKTLLTILTIVLAIVVPILVGPEKIADNKLCLLCEWFFGLLRLIGIAIVGCIVWYIFFAIYDLWDDIID